jgi:uncharacterized protein
VNGVAGEEQKRQFLQARSSGIPWRDEVAEPEPNLAKMPPAATVTPTFTRERIEILDVVRGFALFGVLVSNMSGFKSSGISLRPNGESLWTGPLDHAVTRMIGLAVTMKFVTIFSFLFGVGFALQMLRADARGAPFFPLYARRLLVLLLIGLIHGFLIWFGDILALYAVVGFLLFFFRACKPKILLACAGALFLLSFAKWELILWRQLETKNLRHESVVTGTIAEPPEQVRIQAETALRAYGRGTIAEVMSQRARDALSAYSASFDLSVASNPALRVVGLFLLGLYVGRRGIFQDLSANRSLFREIWKWGLTLALIGNLGLHFLYHPALPSWSSLLRPGATAVGVLALSSCYVSTLVLLSLNPAWKLRLSPLAAVGRMALSNYLLQSVVCTAVFYSYGLGFYGNVGPAAGLTLSLLIFGAQVPLSVWWLRRFRFGPVEWIWRSLTYGKAQPMRMSR